MSATPANRPSGVLALLRDRETVARLTMALRQGVRGTAWAPSGATLTRVERVAELRAALSARAYALVVVERRDADGVATDETVRAIRSQHPGVVVVGYAARAESSSAILAFARAGVHELVVESVDDADRPLRAAIAAAVQRAAADRLLAQVEDLVPPSFIPIVRFCLEHAHEAACNVPGVSKALGLSRQSLVTRTRRAGLPAPHELITWCRLLRAADLLAEAGCSVDHVALELDFPSGNGLRNTLQRYAGLSVKQVREGGGADAVLPAFAAAVAASRVTAPSYLS